MQLPFSTWGFCCLGSAGRTRTYNQWINSPLLCQLSYRGMVPTGPVRLPTGLFYSESSLVSTDLRPLAPAESPAATV